MHKTALGSRQATTGNAQAIGRHGGFSVAAGTAPGHISVHAPRTSLIDAEWDLPPESEPVPSAVRRCQPSERPSRAASASRRVAERLSLLLAGLVIGACIVFGLSVVKIPNYMAQVKAAAGLSASTGKPMAHLLLSPPRRNALASAATTPVGSNSQVQAPTPQSTQAAPADYALRVTQTSANRGQPLPTAATRKVAKGASVTAYKAHRALAKRRGVIASDNPY